MGLFVISSLEAQGNLVLALRIHIISNLKNKTAEANLYISCAPNVPDTTLIVARKADVEKRIYTMCKIQICSLRRCHSLLKTQAIKNEIASQAKSWVKFLFCFVSFSIRADLRGLGRASNSLKVICQWLNFIMYFYFVWCIGLSNLLILIF
jgi:hypothetical protein